MTRLINIVGFVALRFFTSVTADCSEKRCGLNEVLVNGVCKIVAGGNCNEDFRRSCISGANCNTTTNQCECDTKLGRVEMLYSGRCIVPLDGNCKTDDECSTRVKCTMGTCQCGPGTTLVNTPYGAKCEINIGEQYSSVSILSNICWDLDYPYCSTKYYNITSGLCECPKYEVYNPTTRQCDCTGPLTYMPKGSNTCYADPNAICTMVDFSYACTCPSWMITNLSSNRCDCPKYFELIKNSVGCKCWRNRILDSNDPTKCVCPEGTEVIGRKDWCGCVSGAKWKLDGTGCECKNGKPMSTWLTPNGETSYRCSNEEE